MKRDMDLVRQILQKVEECESFYGLDHIPEIKGHTMPLISYHIKLLCEADLIEAQPIVEHGIGYDDYYGINLTWSGQDFLNAVKDDTIWRKAKETVIKPGASFTFDLLLEWLKMKVGEPLGLS